MSQQIQTQAAKLWQTVQDPETAETYRKTGLVTWTLIKETGYLLWLVVCLVLVLGEWIWKSGYRAGWNFRDWINSLERPTTDRLLSETGKSLLTAGKTGVAIALSTAKDQLGIETEPEPVAVSAAPSIPAAAPEPAKKISTPESTSTAATSSASAYSPPPAASASAPSATEEE